MGFIEYDTADSSPVTDYSSSVIYDDDGQVGSITYYLNYLYNTSSIGGENIQYIYLYNPDKKISSMTTYGTVTTGDEDYTYDAYDRISGITYDHRLNSSSSSKFTNSIAYTYTGSGSSTSGQIASYSSTVNGVTTTYYLEGSRIVAENRNESILLALLHPF